MKAWGRIAIGIPAALVLVAIAAYDVKVGVANVQAREVDDEVSTWASLAGGPRPDTVASLDADIARFAPSAPDPSYVLELQALIAVRRPSTDEGMARARSLFSKAAEGRPVSPYTWANLAHVDYQLGRTGDEFQAALRNAAALGPWEPDVQATVVNYGLAVMDEVTPQTRAAIEQMVANAMRRNPLETLQIAERRGRLDAACQRLVKSPGETIKRYSQCQ